MSSEEAASELGKLVDLMDGDKDGFVSREELVNWVMLSFKLVNCSGHQIGHSVQLAIFSVGLN